MKFKIQISKWTDPYVVRYLWSETEYFPLSPGSGPSALLSIWIKGRKDRYFVQKVTIYKEDLVYNLGPLAFVFFTIVAIVILRSWIL